MFHVVTNKNEVMKYQRQFEKNLSAHFSKKLQVRIGFHGRTGGGESDVLWNNKNGIYVKFQDMGTRYWNAFGYLTDPANKNVGIVTEINFQYEGINRAVAGAFLKSNSGDIFVAHSGKIGGGKVGIGKTLFINNYRGNRVIATDTTSQTEFAIIGDLKSIDLFEQVCNFVNEVNRIKNLAEGTISRAGKGTSKKRGFFSPEYEDRKEYDLNKRIKADCNHGIIVNQLAAQLEKRGHTVNNNRYIDLYITKRGNVKAIFEVKTSIDTQTLYAAIGQLLLHGHNSEKIPKLYLVIGSRLKNKISDILNNLGIDIILFKKRNNNYTFNYLNRI